MIPDKEPDLTPHHWMPTRSEMCAQLGTVVLGSFKLFQQMSGSYGENWYALLDMIREQQVELAALKVDYSNLFDSIKRTEGLG